MKSTTGNLKEKLDYSIQRVREDFPILRTKVYGKPLVYLDNAATTQKPLSVLQSIQNYYSETNSNIHRGIHALSEKATEEYEEARQTIQKFIGASNPNEILFVRGATEAINLVAHSYGLQNVREGDEIVVSTLEHHSNIVPWQILCDRVGAKLKVIPIQENGDLRIEEYKKLLNQRTRIVALTHVSNALGTINPIRTMIESAHDLDIPVLIDGAQGIPHLKINVQDLDCDFYAFSGHKIYGPTGIGILYGKEKFLESMPPYQGGGDMIRSVTFEKTTYNHLPYKFEAGTPHIAGAIGLSTAIQYLNQIGLEAINFYEKELVTTCLNKLSTIPEIKIVGSPQDRAGVISFLLDAVHPHDVGTILDREGVAIRAGHHCAMPLMQRLGVSATCRASFACYNTIDEIDVFVRAIEKAREVFC